MATTMAAALVAQTATGGVGLKPGPYSPVSTLGINHYIEKVLYNIV